MLRATFARASPPKRSHPSHLKRLPLRLFDGLVGGFVFADQATFARASPPRRSHPSHLKQCSASTRSSTSSARSTAKIRPPGLRCGGGCRHPWLQIRSTGYTASVHCCPNTPRSRRRSTSCCRRAIGRASHSSSTTAGCADEQCRQTRPAWGRSGPKAVAFCGIRARWAARSLYVFPDRDGQVERCRSPGVARRRHRQDLRHHSLTAAGTAALGLEECRSSRQGCMTGAFGVGLRSPAPMKRISHGLTDKAALGRPLCLAGLRQMRLRPKIALALPAPTCASSNSQGCRVVPRLRWGRHAHGPLKLIWIMPA